MSRRSLRRYWRGGGLTSPHVNTTFSVATSCGIILICDQSFTMATSGCRTLKSNTACCICVVWDIENDCVVMQPFCTGCSSSPGIWASTIDVLPEQSQWRNVTPLPTTISIAESVRVNMMRVKFFIARAKLATFLIRGLKILCFMFFYKVKPGCSCSPKFSFSANETNFSNGLRGS